MAKLSFQYVRQEKVEELCAFLERRFRYHTREEWEGLVGKGFVKVNGRKVSPRHILETRHKIVYETPPFPEPEIDRRFEVLYEDAHLLAVSKSGNIPTSPSGKYWKNCLVHVVKGEMDLPWLHAVHRLDRETSGVNLLAKTKEAARTLGFAFQQGRVRKRYSAVLMGHLKVRQAYVSAPLRDATGGAIRIKQAVHPLGRESRTRFELKCILPGASLVHAVPITGRTHQVRAHASFLGHPVAGDKLYGASETEFLQWVRQDERKSAARHLLHSSELTFPHPESGQAVTLRASDKVLLELYLGGIRPPSVRGYVAQD